MIYRFSEVSEADTGNIEAVALYFFTYLLSYICMMDKDVALQEKLSTKT
jgi:hypothetical protein